MIFDICGRFDEDRKWGGEDLEFFQRVRLSGIESWYIPTAVVHHMIPPYRLKEKYLFWKSLWEGAVFAYSNYKEWGIVKTTLACIARMGQALFVNLPCLFWSYLVNDHAEILGRKCLLWRAVSYMRCTLDLLAPQLFPQERFFSGLEFRRERGMFLQDCNVTRNEHTEK